MSDRTMTVVRVLAMLTIPAMAVACSAEDAGTDELSNQPSQQSARDKSNRKKSADATEELIDTTGSDDVDRDDANDTAPPPAEDTEAPPSDDGAAPKAEPVTYRGTLDVVAPVNFGGASYCNYSVTMSKIVVTLVEDPTGAISNVKVSDHLVEKTVGSCPYAPSSPQDQTFTVKSVLPYGSLGGLGAGGADGYIVQLDGSKNDTKTDLTIVLTKSALFGYEASATWHRTDVSKPLDWTVKAKFDVVRQFILP